MTSHVLIVAGTRPEVIKLRPVWQALAKRQVPTDVVLLLQQKDLLRDHIHDLPRAIYLELSRVSGSLVELLAEEYGQLDTLDWSKYAIAVVQGDTTTALAVAQAAFYEGVPVAHVEAGLRTRTVQDPFPEEMNRRLITQLASVHYAPTPRAAERVCAERPDLPPSDVLVTGQTGIDAFHSALREAPSPAFYEAIEPIRDRGPCALVTAHRRENQHMDALIAAIDSLEQRQLSVIWPHHPSRPGIGSTHPFTHADMARLVTRAEIVITDSGGLSEEACEAERPCIILRRETERPEVLDSHCVLLPPSGFAELPTLVCAMLNREMRGRQSKGRLGLGCAGELIAVDLERRVRG